MELFYFPFKENNKYDESETRLNFLFIKVKKSDSRNTSGYELRR